MTDIDLQIIIARLREITPALKAEGISKLWIFGSRARGDARADSDLDILVDPVAHGALPSFDEIQAMRSIEKATGIPAPLTADIGSLVIEALRAGLSVYDLQYIRLAQTFGIPLATSDEAMRRAARRMNVSLFNESA